MTYLEEDLVAMSSEYLEQQELLNSEANPEIAMALGTEIPSLSAHYDQIAE